MKIDLASIINDLEREISLDGQILVRDLDFPSRRIIINEPVNYSGRIFKASGEILIDLTISYKYLEECSRCMKPTLIEQTSKLFGKLIGSKEDLDLADTITYESDLLDLEEIVLNQISLSLPMRTLCNEDCKGLCPKCGMDLNIEACKCVLENIDPRLEGLRNMFPEN